MKGPHNQLAETRLPRFRTYLGPSTLSNHQYSLIQDLTVQVYPLRADMAVLRRFIDSFLNFVDDVERPPFYFQPVFPYVFMQLLHYPRLAVSTQNLTSFKQHEVTFSIPLACYEILDGKLVFKQFASCTPFIYLDQGVSIVGGRSLFGWPKVALNFADVHPPDIPTEDAQQVNLQLRVPSITGDKFVPFIEAFRSPRPGTSMRRTPADSLTTAADAFSAYFSAAAEQWYSMLQLPIGGYEQARDIESMQAMGVSMADLFSALLPMFPLYRIVPTPYTSTADVLLGPSYMDIITLKQIRDAEYVQHAAFQSVVRSTMYLDRVHDFGFLFNPMAADPSSDIKILIYSEPDQRVVESLGLEVSDRHGYVVSGQNGRGEQTVSILKPRFPYWVNMDLVYGLGTNLYWRGVDTSWSSDESPRPGSRTPSSRYSTFGGGAQQESPLSVVSPQGLVYIATLPLEQSGPQKTSGAEKLNALIGCFLKNERYDFQLYEPPKPQQPEEKPVPPYLWLLVRKINDSGVGLPPSTEQELVLGTFVEWKTKAAKEPEGIGFLPLYSLTDSQSRALTHSEVFGRPIVLSTFVGLGATWPWPAVGPKTEFDALAANTSILPTLFSGATPEERELIKITANHPMPTKDPALPETEPSKKSWPITLVKRRFAQKKEPPKESESAYPDSLVIVSLAQVIDCRLPTNDSYQAIVMQLTTARAATNDKSLHILGGKTHKQRDYQLCIKFTRYESVPIVKTFGLETLPPQPGVDATIELVRAKSHGWVDAAIEENSSINFAWRLGASDWQYPEPPDDWQSKLKRLDPDIVPHMAQVRKFIEEF